MQKILFVLFLLGTQAAFAQIGFGGFLGATGYIGDLNTKPLKRMKPAVGFTFIYEVNNHLNLRSSLLMGNLEGGDKFSGTEFLKRVRNLSFKTELTEIHAGGELILLDLDKYRWSPYGFGGITLFHFNPYVKEGGNRIYLRPLSTEGQGLQAYPDRKPYALTHFAIPFGGGFKYKYNEFFVIGWELSWRRTFSDYLDDVSKTYPDPEALLAAKGPQAVEYSYRGQIRGFPTNDIRGGPKKKYWYYFTGVHVVYRLVDVLNNRKSKSGKTTNQPTAPRM